jgi:uncharacterized protein (TIGR02118 family)
MDALTALPVFSRRIAMGVFKPTVVAASLLISSVALAGEVKITALYSQPKSTEEFDKYYYGTHMPMVYAIKEIKRVEVSRPRLCPTGAPSPYYVLTELWLESPEALKAVAATPQRLTEDVQAGGARQEALRPIGPIRTAANLRLIRTRRDDPLTTFKTVT